MQQLMQLLSGLTALTDSPIGSAAARLRLELVRGIVSMAFTCSRAEVPPELQPLFEQALAVALANYDARPVLIDGQVQYAPMPKLRTWGHGNPELNRLIGAKYGSAKEK